MDEMTKIKLTPAAELSALIHHKFHHLSSNTKYTLYSQQCTFHFVTEASSRELNISIYKISTVKFKSLRHCSIGNCERQKFYILKTCILISLTFLELTYQLVRIYYGITEEEFQGVIQLYLCKYLKVYEKSYFNFFIFKSLQ